MRICIISQNLYTLGGVQRVVTAMIDYLQATFMDDICVIMPLNESDAHCFDISDKIEIIDLSEKFLKCQGRLTRYLKAVNRRIALMDNNILLKGLDKFLYSKRSIITLADYLNEKSFDWIIGVGDIYALLVGMLADRLNAKTAGWMHSTFKGYYETRGHASYGLKKLNALYLKKLDKLFVLNNSDRKRFNHEFLVNSDLLYNSIKVGVPNSSFAKKNQLLFVGRLNSRVKGLDYLLQIIESVTLRIPDCCLTIVGEGTDKRYLEEKIAEKYLKNKVNIVGFQKNVEQYYIDSKLVLSTSRWEGFGMSLIEAMAYGTPCIAFENDGPNDVIQSEVNGILIPKFDITEFADKIIEYLTDERKYTALAQNAYLRSGDFSISAIATQFRDYLLCYEK